MRIPTTATLLLLATGALRAQPASPLELNRVFMTDATTLHAVELDGTIAWSVPLPGPIGSTAGTTVDGRGYVWVVDTTAPAALRYRTDGTLDLTVPIASPLGSLVRMPAVDRQGNAYFCFYIPNPLVAYGYESHVIKLDPAGVLQWDRDLTPELATSVPPTGLLDQVRVDEDSNLWCILYNPSGLGGRVVKMDPQGNILWSIPNGAGGIQIGIDRTVEVVRRIAPLQPPKVVRYRFDGTFLILLAVPGAVRAGLNEFLAHPSGSHLRFAVRTIYGAQHPAPMGVGFGYEAMYQGSVGSPAGTDPYPWNVALAPDGRLWSVSYPQQTVWNNASAIRYGSFVPTVGGGGYYPITTQTPLGPSLPYPSIAFRGDNRGARFTAYDWCLIVDPWGDVDGDGVMNRNEILAGTNPCDPSSVQALLVASNLALGQTASLLIGAPADHGLTYTSVMSLTPGPPQPLGDGRAFAPSLLDPLAGWWMSATNPFVTAATGVLDAQGQTVITFSIPSTPSLGGLQLHFGFATVDPLWSQTLRTLLGPVTLSLPGSG